MYYSEIEVLFRESLGSVVEFRDLDLLGLVKQRVHQDLGEDLVDCLEEFLDLERLNDLITVV